MHGPSCCHSTLTNLRFFNLSAGDGVDYQTIANASVAFQPGDTTKFFTFTINDDSIVEQNEDLLVTITMASSATIGNPNAATVSIHNNDCKKTLFWWLSVIDCSSVWNSNESGV